MSVSAFHQKYNLSPELQAVCGKATELSRPHIVGKLWKYIKAKGLQNKDKKVEIINDDNMKAVFKCDRMTMFEMNKKLSKVLRGRSSSGAKSATRKAKRPPCNKHQPPAQKMYLRKGKRFCRNTKNRRSSSK